MSFNINILLCIYNYGGHTNFELHLCPTASKNNPTAQVLASTCTLLEQTRYLVQSVEDGSATNGASGVAVAHAFETIAQGGNKFAGRSQSEMVGLKWSPTPHVFGDSTPSTHKMYLSHAVASATCNIKSTHQLSHMINKIHESFLITLETPVAKQSWQPTTSFGAQVLSAMLNTSGVGHVWEIWNPSTHEKYFAQPDGSLTKPPPVAGHAVKAGTAIA